MKYKTLMLRTDPRGVATLTLNRPDKRNAMSGAMIADLARAGAALARDASVRVVVLTGAGGTFCAGGDLRWMQAQISASGAERATAARALAMMLQTLNTLPKPLIGRIQGDAFGGGVGLASVCDVAIGDQNARFGLTETRLGLIPATIGPYVIARMGEANARRVFMSSRVFSASEAVSLGLIAHAVDARELDAAVEREVAPYLDCAPGAVAEAKALARRLGPPIEQSTIDMSVEALVNRWQSEEAGAGIAAFFAKKPAPWSREG